MPPGAWMSVSCECCLSSGGNYCDRLIPRTEDSYRLCVCVCHCVIRCNSNPLHAQRGGTRSQTKKERTVHLKQSGSTPETYTTHKIITTVESDVDV
jgi:hypothetical protein